MSKKLMLLAAGALSALVFAALPAVASAGEFEAHCSSGANCTFTVAGGHTELENDAGGLLGRITCTSVSGNFTQTNTSSTGSAKLTFHGCKELVFNTQCRSGAINGTIETNTMVSHLIRLEGGTTPVGVLLTNINVGFSCPAVGVTKAVTGNVIGEIEDPNCKTARNSFKLSFQQGVATGTQKWSQVTTAGTVFDLTSGATHNTADQTTSAQIGTGTVTLPAGQTATLTC